MEFTRGPALGMALIWIVLASWLFYRFAAPKSWREWTGAGLVQAFLIALYAEMYGFPLTIYLLARFFGLDSSGPLSWNLWSNLLGLGELGMTLAMLLGMGLALLGIAVVVQGWRELHAATREGRLATGGPYAVVRHPQYLGFLLVLFGEGVVHWPTLLSVSLFPVIAVAYVLLARHEEKQMRARFGEAYRQYAERVPAFVPRPGDWSRLFRVRSTACRTGI